ncbi:hypothetical protein MLD38_015890 [Melastoma candidum]|uniref:Uncharacterized protein n=1 Tax=Melastoma candidum TaxID=119954 RepID=A0ACB9RLA2_9MYRT|nr:hypothetical protein MLD38_015890 [Melastoma candidum]
MGASRVWKDNFPAVGSSSSSFSRGGVRAVVRAVSTVWVDKEEEEDEFLEGVRVGDDEGEFLEDDEDSDVVIIAEDVTHVDRRFGSFSRRGRNKVAVGCVANVAATMESMEPCRSVKDRIGYSLITDLVERGLRRYEISLLERFRFYLVCIEKESSISLVELNNGDCLMVLYYLRMQNVLVEPTSGNTGLGISVVAPTKWYKLIITMLASIYGKRFILKQQGLKFGKAHWATWICLLLERELGGQLQVIGVEPADRSIISGDNPGYMPSILDVKILDEVIKVTKDEAVMMARRLALEEGRNFERSCCRSSHELSEKAGKCWKAYCGCLHHNL